MSVFVTLLPDGKKYPVKAGASLLQLDHAIPFGCCAGACGMCAVQIHSHQKALSPMAEEEKSFLECLRLDISRYRLACQCRVLSDVTIEI